MARAKTPVEPVEDAGADALFEERDPSPRKPAISADIVEQVDEIEQSQQAFINRSLGLHGTTVTPVSELVRLSKSPTIDLPIPDIVPTIDLPIPRTAIERIEATERKAGEKRLRLAQALDRRFSRFARGRALESDVRAVFEEWIEILCGE